MDRFSPRAGDGGGNDESQPLGFGLFSPLSAAFAQMLSPRISREPSLSRNLSPPSTPIHGILHQTDSLNHHQNAADSKGPLLDPNSFPSLRASQEPSPSFCSRTNLPRRSFAPIQGLVHQTDSLNHHQNGGADSNDPLLDPNRFPFAPTEKPKSIRERNEEEAFEGLDNEYKDRGKRMAEQVAEGVRERHKKKRKLAKQQQAQQLQPAIQQQQPPPPATLHATQQQQQQQTSVSVDPSSAKGEPSNGRRNKVSWSTKPKYEQLLAECSAGKEYVVIDNWFDSERDGPHQYFRHPMKPRFFKRLNVKTGEASLWHRDDEGKWKACHYYIPQQLKHDDSAAAVKFALEIYKKILWDDPQVAAFLPRNKKNPKTDKEAFRMVLNHVMKVDFLEPFARGVTDGKGKLVKGFWDTDERQDLEKEWTKAQSAARGATQPPSTPQVTLQIGTYFAPGAFSPGAFAAGTTVNFGAPAPAPPARPAANFEHV